MATVTVVDTPSQTITVPSSTTFAIGGAPTYTTKSVTNTYTMSSTDNLLFADPTTGAFTLNLPTAVGFNSVLNIICTTAGTNVLTLKPVTGQKINSASTVTLGSSASSAAFKGGVTIVSDGANWWIIK